MFWSLAGERAVENCSIQAVTVLQACFNEGTSQPASEEILSVSLFWITAVHLFPSPPPSEEGVGA